MSFWKKLLPESSKYKKSNTNETESMRLIHPIYLDVPMLVSFAAALQGGVAFGSEITEELSKAKSKNKSYSGELGISNLFSQLFNASVAAESSTDASNSKSRIKTESKSHTESSIAIILYDQLSHKGDQLKKLANLDSFEKIEPGMLVELAGTLEKNAIDSIIDYFDAFRILVSLDTSQKEQKINSSQEEFEKFRNTLDEDRQRTPISNMLLKCSKPKDLTATVTLRTENLRDLTLSELHKNEVKVVGKITRIIPEGEKMSSFENYGMSMANPDILRDTIKDLEASEDVNVDISEITVSGPALQILPLMIFV